ncbi:MAG: hypothetical protein MZV63_52690 [Marinilabiliales bacterium]|nr:hypothetical protein [Marinilabiliales bacterium]
MTHETRVFHCPVEEEDSEPGIDVYDGEWFVIYDPVTTSYWIPVTVNEAFAAVKGKCEKQKRTR